MTFIYTYICLPDEQSAPVSKRIDVLDFLSYDETRGIITLWEKKM